MVQRDLEQDPEGRDLPAAWVSLVICRNTSTFLQTFKVQKKTFMHVALLAFCTP